MEDRINLDHWEFKKGKVYLGEHLTKENYTISKGNLILKKTGKQYYIVEVLFDRLILYDQQNYQFGCYERFVGSKRWLD